MTFDDAIAIVSAANGAVSSTEILPVVGCVAFWDHANGYVELGWTEGQTSTAWVAHNDCVDASETIFVPEEIQTPNGPLPLGPFAPRLLEAIERVGIGPRVTQETP